MVVCCGHSRDGRSQGAAIVTLGGWRCGVMPVTAKQRDPVLSSTGVRAPLHVAGGRRATVGRPRWSAAPPHKGCAVPSIVKYS